MKKVKFFNFIKIIFVAYFFLNGFNHTQAVNLKTQLKRIYLETFSEKQTQEIFEGITKEAESFLDFNVLAIINSVNAGLPKNLNLESWDIDQIKIQIQSTIIPKQKAINLIYKTIIKKLNGSFSMQWFNKQLTKTKSSKIGRSHRKYPKKYFDKFGF